jgi:hypothetical protein
VDEISELVAAYNENEREQQIRLERLYVLMAARTGARNVYFGDNHQWCQWEYGADLKGLISFITSVNEGGE